MQRHVVFTVHSSYDYSTFPYQLFTGCSSGTNRVISYDNTLVPQAGVMASSEDTLFNPDDDLFHRSNIPLRLWCSESFEEAQRSGGEGMELSDMQFPNESRSFDISVNFSRPLLLTHIITSGFSNGYVSNFSVQSSMDDGPLSPYSYSDTMQVAVIKWSQLEPLIFPLEFNNIRLLGIHVSPDQ